MRKYLLPSLLILGLSASLAFAQTITKALQLSPDTTGAFSVDSNSGVYFPGHVLFGPGTLRPAPVLTSCGTAPAIAGTDFAGTVTMGTGSPTGCVITFGTAYGTAPTCVVNWVATPLASQSWTTSTTALTLTQTGTSSNKASYICSSAS
jgi:hypothetical protein